MVNTWSNLKEVYNFLQLIINTINYKLKLKKYFKWDVLKMIKLYKVSSNQRSNSIFYFSTMQKLFPILTQVNQT